MSALKILVVTGTRADYGLLYPVLDRLRREPSVDLRIVATCMHLSHRFGHTVDEIEQDGFKVHARVDMQLDDDSEIGIVRSMGLGIAGLGRAYETIQPDAVLVLGDRFEILMAVSAANIMRIPVVHLGGGDLTEGAIDDSFRHAITKMSNLHFTGTEQYRKRIVQMGEQPENVHAFGQTPLDNILNEERIPKDRLETDIGFRFGDQSLLVTYHPATRDELLSPTAQIEQLLSALDRFPSLNVLFTAANADPGGQEINQVISEAVRQRSPRWVLVASLGRRRYASAMAYVDAVIGNSSSGLTETPSFGIGAVNIGDRQKGRLMADNVVNCRCETQEISAATVRVLSPEFRKLSAQVSNPFGDGHAAERIVATLLRTDFSKLRQKSFYNADFGLNPEGVLKFGVDRQPRPDMNGCT